MPQQPIEIAVVVLLLHLIMQMLKEASFITDWIEEAKVEAAVEARDKGLVRFIGVTGHGSRVAEMHLKSLDRFPFDSVLLPYNFTMNSQLDYAADFEELYRVCQQRGVAIQTIKSIARRRWQGEDGPRYSWYEPLRDPAAIRRAVRYVLVRPGLAP